MTTLILFTTIVIITTIINHFNPTIDKSKDGSIIIWYNTNREKNSKRKYIKLIKTNKSKD